MTDTTPEPGTAQPSDPGGLSDTWADDVAAAVAELVAQQAPPVRRPRPDPTQGARAGSVVGGQLNSEDARRMSPSQIVAAKKAGQFDDLLAGRLR